MTLRDDIFLEAKRARTATAFKDWIFTHSDDVQHTIFATILDAGFSPDDFYRWRQGASAAELHAVKRNVVRRIAASTTDALDDMVGVNQARFRRSITKLENRIKVMAGDIDTSRGRLIGVKANLKQVQGIHKRLASTFDDLYGNAARETVAGFSGVIRRIRRNFRDLDLVMEFTDVDLALIRTLEAQALDQFATFSNTAQARVRDAMMSATLSGGNFSELLDTITGIFSGHTDVRGVPMAVHANQAAFDVTMNFHNQVTLAKAADAGIEDFLYVGDLIKTSRDFCKTRAGQVFSQEEIEGWTFNWQGKAGPAMTHRGGYNCRHHWTPVAEEWVPEEGIEVQDVTEE